MRSFAIAVGVLALAALSSSAAVANVPPMINYQGHLTDGGGTPLDGDFDLWFTIYGDSVAWTPYLWSEKHQAVPVEAGLFSVILGAQSPFTDAVFSGGECWLSINVGADPEILPRMRFTAVPWAFRAALAESVISGGGTAPHDHDDLYYRKYELNTSGSLNDPSNPVDWTKLKSVPAGFADGVDNVGTGGGGLELPYQGQSTTSSSAFWVRNTNASSVGAAIRGDHLTTGAEGRLGYGTYGVYGYSASDFAGYFDGKGCFSGYVGIGTTNPQSSLHVEGTLRVDNTIQADDADGLYFATTGGSIMRIQDDGRIGIGTMSPETEFHVNGTMTLNQKIIADDTGGLEFATDEGTTRIKITDAGYVGIGTMAPETPLHVEGTLTIDHTIKADDADGLYFATTGGYAMRILDNGYVGVGTTAPETRLHVEGVLTVDNTIQADDADGLYFNTDGGYAMRITDGGYVGIGTNTPETLCHINGSLTVDQTIIADDSGGLSFATDDSAIRMAITDDGDIGIGTSDPGSHQLYVKSSDGGASGATLFCENDNATNGIAGFFENASSDLTVLMSQRGAGDILRMDGRPYPNW